MIRLYHRIRKGWVGFYAQKNFFWASTSILLILFLIALILLQTYPFWKSDQVTDIIRGFLFGSTKNIFSEDGRTNFVLLGIDRRGESSPTLTDTILFFSLDHRGLRHILISLPRDIWIPQMRAKLNTAYYYGNEQEGNGLNWAKRFVSDIVGQPVHYGVVMSFDGFVELVDLLSGVDIYVERGFVDNRYPIAGRENDDCGADPQTRCRWETVKFEQGLQHMDGETALKFARSRHAEGDEGTDFARASRQRKVFIAVRNKILSLHFLLNPEKLEKLLAIINKNVESDIPQPDIGILARVFYKAREVEIVSETISEIDKDSGFLVHPPISDRYDQQWVLVPEEGNWKKVHEWVESLKKGQD